MSTESTSTRRRIRVRVQGTVQGVGFRPYVYRLAGELGLAGFVLNDERGVLVEVQADADSVERFLERLPAEAPPLARIERVSCQDLALGHDSGFSILASERSGTPAAPVAPDSATCEECLRELFDPSDRRYRYPFVNCTNCGPRFTIVRDVPYDRTATTMAEFQMCRRCRAEYDDPHDRRFHAQPNACPDCGPSVRLALRGGASAARGAGEDAIAAAGAALRAGAIVAVKGLGGYHLACLAADERAVKTLRSRKHREDRPFALMVADVESAHALGHLGESEVALLAGPERPIVLVASRSEAPVARAVAPGLAELGLLLAYTPVHHLLLADVGAPLVMTSANVSDEPIAYRDADALGRLGEIADRFLIHDRPIHVRVDDSVLRAGAHPLMVRRSRGYVPASLRLPLDAQRQILACGAELKSTFCLAKGSRAWVGHHIGDLKNYETLRSFQEGVGHFERLFDVQPELVAHDLHPDYLSTAYALEREGVECCAVAHHHAHLAACLAEHGEQGPAVGAIYDGTGYGPDGTVWGGEILVGDLVDFERRGCLYPVRMPGGERAIREPWRMACAWLAAAVGDEPALPRALAAQVSATAWSRVATLGRTGVASPVTTSAGRLFDALAALCGVRAHATYEGQAAVELEVAADRREHRSYPLALTPSEGLLMLDARETVSAVMGDLAQSEAVGTVAARFHNALAGATSEACARVAESQGIVTVVLSGGVFQNRLLLERTAQGLERRGLRVLVPRLLPPNDGGISYGQAVVAAARC